MKDVNWQALSYMLIVLVGVVMLTTFLDYGVTLDEETQSIYGDNVLAWYGSFFRDRRALDFTFMYGGFFDAIAQLASRVLPFGVYESRHLVNCLFGLMAIVAAYKLGAHVGGAMAGFFSALFLTITPVLYGHSFNNPKDIPFSTLCLISLYFILVSYRQLPRLPNNLVAKLGLSVGLAMGVRVGGMMLFGFLAALFLAWLIVQFRLKSPFLQLGVRKKTILALGLSAAFVVIISWVVMLACWPWAQVKPLIDPFRALATFARFDMRIKSFYDGEYILSFDLPWHYLPRWFSISLPEFYFISLLAGCGLACSFALKLKDDPAHLEKLINVLMLIGAAVLPITTAILLRSPLYDAQRHFLFTIPPLAIVAAISFASLLKARVHLLAKAGVSAMIAISAGLTVVDMVQLHPYEYVYFNRLIAGGLKAASQEFDTDYWGSSYKEGADWVIDNYLLNTPERIRIATCSSDFLTKHYFNRSEQLVKRFEPVDTHEDPSLLLATTRYQCHERKWAKGKVLHIVERQGVPLLYVIELHSPQ
ncbi:MAG TPA: glycosyltransferase family 39 protein [Blastocatellia bacterium]|nr:glycosyltransferase family 39 protein [Blastocatellia bacterium]